MSLVPQNPFRRGEVLTARRLRAMQDARADNVGGDGVSVMGNNELHQTRQHRGGGVSVMGYRVTAVYGDYIEAKQINGSALLAEVTKIAKPYQLRQTPFDGLTVDGIEYDYSSATERDATAGAVEETQRITPSYTLSTSATTGSIIFAIGPVTNTSAVILNNGQESQENLEWLDLNVDGRAWAKIPD